MVSTNDVSRRCSLGIYKSSWVKTIQQRLKREGQQIPININFLMRGINCPESYDDPRQPPDTILKLKATVQFSQLSKCTLYHVYAGPPTKGRRMAGYISYPFPEIRFCFILQGIQNFLGLGTLRILQGALFDQTAYGEC